MNLDRQRELIYQAWHTAMLTRAKKFPELNKVMPTVHNKPTREQTVSNMRAFFGGLRMKAEAQNKAGGGNG